MGTLLVRSIGLLGLLVGNAARAADMPMLYKAPPPVYKAPQPVSADMWSGFYVGLNAGGSVGQSRTTDTTVLPGLFFPVFDFASFSHGPPGGVFGAQAGWNWHAAPSWVLGVEADWQWSGQSETVCTYACLPSSSPGALLSVIDQQSLKWFATARGRIGWLSPGGSLLYATGGAAWGRVDQSLSLTGTPFFFATGTSAASRFSQEKIGWTVGAGIETPIANQWSLKVEYLYVDLGNVTNSLTTPLEPGQAPATVQTTTSSSNIHDHIVRFGVNYRFGGAAGVADMPIPSMYYKAQVRPPAQEWTGLYAGINGGAFLARNATNDTTTVPNAAFPVFGADSFSHVAVAALLGAQVGWNWRIASSWVLGAEADWQWGRRTDSACVSECLPTGVPGLLLGLNDEQTMKWLGTARGRFGWVAPNGSLWYATGGAAWGRVDETLSLIATPTFLAAGAANAASFSHDRAGWTAGAGVEMPLWDKLSVKAEYLYVNLGTVTDSFTSALDPIQLPATSQTTSSSSSIREHIFRLGLNYHLY
jgi:outer membrane immunogenic protein